MLVKLAYVTLCHLFKSSETDTDGFTLQVHKNLALLSPTPKGIYFSLKCTGLQFWSSGKFAKPFLLTAIAD